MTVQVEFQSLIGGANCVNGGTAPPSKSLVRTLDTMFLYIHLSCLSVFI